MSLRNTTHPILCDCYECADPYVQQLLNMGNKANVVDYTGRVRKDDFAKEYENIAWNTQPILANPLTALWSDYWGPKTWIKWHQLVKDKYGKDRANEVLIEWFEKAPFGSPTTDYRTFDNEFIQYAKDNGFYNALFKGIGGLLGKFASTENKVIEGGTKVIDSVGNAVDSASDIASFLGNNLKWIIAAVVLIVIVFVFLKFKK